MITTTKIIKMNYYLVMSSVGPEKLELGRNKPAATSLVVSVVNLSAKIVISAFGNSFFNASDVLRPTTPAPITQMFIIYFVATIFNDVLTLNSLLILIVFTAVIHFSLSTFICYHGEYRVISEFP